MAYSFFEHHPDRALIGDLLAALDKEQGEFVRPAARPRARGARRRVRRCADSPDAAPGSRTRRRFLPQRRHRSARRLQGDLRLRRLTAIAKLDGPLQDDAALALGKIGDKRALETLARLQRTAPRQSQPTVAAAICLLGVNCGSHENYLIETLKFARPQSRLSGTAARRGGRLGALASPAATTRRSSALFDGRHSVRDDPTRAPVALALATVALRNTPLMLSMLEKHIRIATHAIALLAEGFDMLEEDLDKERSSPLARRTYWESPEGSPTRELMQTLIGKLDF